MARKTGKEIAEKLIRKAQGASEDYVKGVRNPKRNPMEAAIEKKQKMLNNFQQAMADGKWEDGLRAVTQQEWSDKAATLGGQRYAPGLEASKSKTAAFFDELMPFIESVQAEISKMDDSTLEGRLAKMTANARAMSKFRRTRARRV